MAGEQTGWRVWWAKRRWYERNRRPLRRWRLARHEARGGFLIRRPVEGEVLEALDEGRLRIGEGTLLEPGCWLTLAPGAQIEIGAGCFLNRNTMLAALERIEIGDHVMFANHCFVGDADHKFDDPEVPVPMQGFTSKGPVRIGDNCWFGVNCVVTSGVTIGERCVIG
ncbi:MAG TPA: acyltransferase, partial [Solirubrobacterales bacterium]|nr:acyltransferase [Solirubrobacterales bacterium]